MHFLTTVTFPQPSNDSSISVKSFETDVPDTHHSVKNFLGSKIKFESISLKGSNAGIYVKVSGSCLATSTSLNA